AEEGAECLQKLMTDTRTAIEEAQS
ncbi:hypothetical protein LCGC14_2837250, partial [marine sediment metagenome]